MQLVAAGEWAGKSEKEFLVAGEATTKKKWKLGETGTGH